MKKLFVVLFLCFFSLSNSVFSAETVYNKSVKFPTGQKARYVISEISESEFIIHAYSDHRSKEFHEMMTYLAAKQARKNEFSKVELLKQKKRPGAIKKPVLSAKFRGYNGRKKYTKNQSLNVAQFVSYYEDHGQFKGKKYNKQRKRRHGLTNKQVAGVVAADVLGRLAGLALVLALSR